MHQRRAYFKPARALSFRPSGAGRECPDGAADAQPYFGVPQVGIFFLSKCSRERLPSMDDDPLLNYQRTRARTPTRASRLHQGPGHWHVRARSKVFVCRACGANIPKWLHPRFCPECGSGKKQLPLNADSMQKW
jgi:hypothetical protein